MTSPPSAPRPLPLSLVLMTMVMTMVAMTTVTEGAATPGGKVLMVSMSGFRWDYLDTVTGLTHFPELARTGVSVKHLSNPFVTMTYATHYSIATGLYQESHGIISDYMYDVGRNESFHFLTSKESFWWDGGEPIWVTAERQNKRSGVYFWAGSEAEIRGYRPSTYVPYNQSVPFSERVRTAVSWFLPPVSKDVVLVYMEQPDAVGHAFGPGSIELADKVRELDGILGQLLQELDQNNLTDQVNLIVTSDHGMADVNMQTRLLNLWDYVDRSLVARVPIYGAFTSLLPVQGREADVLAAVRTIPNTTAYAKADIPPEWHYGDNPRVMPIIVLCDEGWRLSANVNWSIQSNLLGDHAFGNWLPSMRPIFLARGPAFRANVRTDAIRSVDIYPLLCHLLGISPAPNNGSLASTTLFRLDGDTGAATPPPALSPTLLLVPLVASLVASCLP